MKDADGTTKWNYIIDQMIYSFEQMLDDSDKDVYYDHSECSYEKDYENFSMDNFLSDVEKIKIDREGLKEYEERVQKGFELFGKYYQNLWW